MGYTIFVSFDPWLRDSYRCVRCLSIPRQRALIKALEIFSPQWMTATIHESSPGGVAAYMIKNKCVHYSSSQYFPEIATGSYVSGIRCENLEALSYSCNCFDIFITQDVLEHVFNPKKVFQEIERVLKPGGMHIFTVPVAFEKDRTEQRAFLHNNTLTHIKSPEYHKNPIDQKGSLVTFDYGNDLPFLIDEWSGLKTIVFLNQNRREGLDGSYLEVYISRKNSCNILTNDGF